MKYRFIVLFGMLVSGSAWGSDIDTAIAGVRSACGGLYAEMENMKRMAGIGTAIGGVGTVAGGVALGTGIAKATVDKKIAYRELKLKEKIAEQQNAEACTTAGVTCTPMIISSAQVQSAKEYSNKQYSEKADELRELNKKSKTLGNVRTGTLGGATVANVAGAVVSGTNMADTDLIAQITACSDSVIALQSARVQEIASAAPDIQKLDLAQRISDACGKWQYVDIESVNKKLKGATIASGVGAGVGMVGLITSAVANKDEPHDDDSDKQKVKNLNTTANVMAGGTTIAGGTSMVLNATTINKIKNIISVADDCEKALR